MTPQAAMATNSAPSGTPIRSCEACAITRIDAIEPAAAVSPPRATRSGLPLRMRGDASVFFSGSLPSGSPGASLAAGRASFGASPSRDAAGATFSAGFADSAGGAGSIMKTTNAPRKHAAAAAQITTDVIPPRPLVGDARRHELVGTGQFTDNSGLPSYELAYEGRLEPAPGQIVVGMYVQDTLEGRLNRPKGRGRIGKVVSIEPYAEGRLGATMDFGRGYVTHSFLTELTPIRFVEPDVR